MNNKLPIPLERDEAKMLVAYLRVAGIKFMHIPSETGSSPEARRRAIRMKQQGTVVGFPDYLCLVYGHVLLIELKRSKKSLSKVSEQQALWITALNECDNVEARVCYGSQEAIDFIISHTDAKMRGTFRF